MPALWIAEPIDVFEDGHLGVMSRSPRPLPQHLRLDGFEERFHRRVVVAIPGSTHRCPESTLEQNLLIAVATILATAIRMADAALGWLLHLYAILLHQATNAAMPDLTFEIGLDGWLLRIAPILLYPAAQC